MTHLHFWERRVVGVRLKQCNSIGQLLSHDQQDPLVIKGSVQDCVEQHNIVDPNRPINKVMKKQKGSAAHLAGFYTSIKKKLVNATHN